MNNITRRSFIKRSVVTSAILTGVVPMNVFADTQKAKVYYAKDVSPAGIIKVYKYIKDNIKGKTAIKVHTGEIGAPNIIPPDWVKVFMKRVDQPTVVECNVLYSSPRQTTKGHKKLLKDNGWDVVGEVDIMDATGEVKLPVSGGKWIKELAVGKNLLNYDSMVVLTHFKGHTMGGFGGSLKNVSIGCASGKTGKEQLHREGSQLWSGGPNFMERMVEGGKAVIDHFKSQIVYINVLRNMSVSCDCEGQSAEPVKLPDIGILASTDVLAVDKASVDMIYKLPKDVSAHMIERIESRSGLHQLTYMKQLGMGNDDYELIEV